MKTIPVYWGCSNIDDYFNYRGILKFNNIDDLIHISNCCIVNSEYDMLHNVIEENYQTALQYISYEQSIINKLEEIFKLNGL
jgi:hypothetical protein